MTNPYESPNQVTGKEPSFTLKGTCVSLWIVLAIAWSIMAVAQWTWAGTAAIHSINSDYSRNSPDMLEHFGNTTVVLVGSVVLPGLFVVGFAMILVVWLGLPNSAENNHPS